MSRPYSYRLIETDNLAQMGIINLHHSRPSLPDYATKVEQVICEMAARIHELNQELDLNLPNNGRAR